MNVKKTIFFPDGRFIWILDSPDTAVVEGADGNTREIRFADVDREMWGKKRPMNKEGRGEAKSQITERRFIRLKDAPAYLGMDPNRFNAEVRPYLKQIPIGKQGIAFDRVDLDAWAEEYKDRNGRPGKTMEGGQSWGRRSRQDLSKGVKSGTSRKQSQVKEFEKALKRATSRKRKDT
jgi:hypothetical protein